MKLDELVERAASALSAARVVKEKKVYVAALGEDIDFYGVDGARRSEIFDAAGGDSRLWVKKLILNAAPALRKLGIELVSRGDIVQYEDVCDIFSEEELSRLAELIGELSDNGCGIGVGGREALKNS